MSVIIFAFIAVFLIYLLCKKPRRPPNFPPGPPTQGILGNLWTMGSAIRDFRKYLANLRRNYGDSIVGVVDPFGTPVIHVFDADLIREISSRKDCSGRPVLFPAMYRSFEKKQGLVFSEGSLWQEHRRFALSHLRNLGFGRHTMDEAIIMEFETIANNFKKVEGQKVEIDANYFNLASLNVIWKLIANKRYEDKDPELDNLIKLNTEFTRFFGPQSPMGVFPWIRFFMPEKSGFNALKRSRDASSKVIDKFLEQHQRTLDKNDPKDFMDVFLMEMETQNATERNFTAENLRVIAMDFFLAGSETTATTMQWAILLGTKFPDTQVRVQQEIDANVEPGTQLTYDMRNRLPYTEAFIMEVLRYGGVVSQTAPHSTSFGPVQLGDFTLPQGTLILMHLDTLKKSKELWGDPEMFRPERFLNEEGNITVPDHFMPFGHGKRSCLGESLARREIFLFFACIMQNFEFKLAPGQDPKTTDPDYGVILRAPNFSVVPRSRH